MKSWALGEELSTMRFTILIRVSLSLICSRGRNGRFKLRLTERRLPHTLLCSPAGTQNRASPLGGSSTLSLASIWPHPTLPL